MTTDSNHSPLLHYREAGTGSPLLIIPGNTASSACHTGELAHFGQHYRVIVVDLPGTGQSRRMARWPHNWWAYGASAVITLLDALQIDQCAVMGTSGGAAVALLATLEGPERITAVIADSVVPYVPPASLQAMLAGRVERSLGQQQFWSLAHGNDWAQVVDADTAMLEGHVPTGIDYFGGRLGRIECPVLLTASLADPLLPEVGPQLCAMVQTLPHGRLFLTNVGDHPLMWSRPDDFWLVADAFLERNYPVLPSPPPSHG